MNESPGTSSHSSRNTLSPAFCRFVASVRTHGLSSLRWLMNTSYVIVEPTRSDPR